MRCQRKPAAPHPETGVIDPVGESGLRPAPGRKKRKRKKPTEYWSCTRKIRYEEAPPVQRAMRAYACNFCGGWHVTKNIAAEAKADPRFATGYSVPLSPDDPQPRSAPNVVPHPDHMR